MDPKRDQRAAVQFCTRLGINGVKTISMIQDAYGDEAMSASTVKRWHKRFREGCETTEDQPRSGRPAEAVTKENIERVRQIVENDRRVTVRYIEEELDIGHSSVHKILTEHLNKRRVCARWVPRLLTEEQKQRRVEVCQAWLREYERKGDDFLSVIITEDETWVFQYEPESKKDSMVWKCPGSPSPKKAKASKSANKTMFVVFFDRSGVILCHAVPSGTTVTSEYYCKVSIKLNLNVSRFCIVHYFIFSYMINILYSKDYNIFVCRYSEETLWEH